jgi:hypothetical protein
MGLETGYSQIELYRIFVNEQAVLTAVYTTVTPANAIIRKSHTMMRLMGKLLIIGDN